MKDNLIVVVYFKQTKMNYMQTYRKKNNPKDQFLART